MKSKAQGMRELRARRKAAGCCPYCGQTLHHIHEAHTPKPKIKVKKSKPVKKPESPTVNANKPYKRRIDTLLH